MLSDATPNKLAILVEERKKCMERFNTLAGRYRQYKDKSDPVEVFGLITAIIPISLIRRLNECIARIKVLNNRIARLGERYNIVRVKGNYLANQGKLSLLKSFELYYTDISEYDATCKARNYFKGKVQDIHTEIIPTGSDKSAHFFK